MLLLTLALSLLIIIILSLIDTSGDMKNIVDTMMKNNYKQIDASNLLTRDGTGMCIVDKNYNIVHSEGSNIFDNKILNASKLTEFIYTASQQQDDIYIKYNEVSHFWLIIKIPRQVKISFQLFITNKKQGDDYSLIIFLFLLAIWLFLLIISILIYSRITANVLKRYFIHIKEIADNIKNGNYIVNNWNNNIEELTDVEDTLVIMSNKILYEMNRAKTSEENRKQLMLDISHDLKNPLMSIKGYVEIMANEQDADKRMQYINVILENSTRADKLTKDLFELSKVENAQYILIKEILDIANLLQTYLIERYEELNLSGLVCTFNIPDEVITIEGNKKELRKVFDNIIDNTLKYGKNNFDVTFSSDEKQVYIIFQNFTYILDDKNDISNHYRILDERNNLNPRGSGIGLAIIRKIVKEHNGTVYSFGKENLFGIKIIFPRQI